LRRNKIAMGFETTFPQLFAWDAPRVLMEDYLKVAALPGAVSRESWPTRKYRAERNTELLLSLLERPQRHAQHRSSCWVGAERSAGLVKRIGGAGHEIAGHGSRTNSSIANRATSALGTTAG
jgi:hypothetical protein